MIDIVKMEGVSKVYASGHTALKGITLDVKQGEFAFIAGASGAGKSTLLKLMYGQVAPTSGRMTLLGAPVPKKERDLAQLRRRIGVVFQDYKLLPRLNVVENVGFPLEMVGVCEAERKKRVMEVLEAVGLATKCNCFPLTLSGGEQQRVAVARALVNRPELLIADEPTGNVDLEMARHIFDLFLAANTAGTTLIVASHDLRLIQRLGKRAILLEKGRVLHDSVPSQSTSEVQCN